MIRPSRSAACDPAMLKVMHVEAGENFYGGARQVAFLIEGLARRGIDNVVVCPEHSLTARRMGELPVRLRSEEHTSELQSLMRISYAVFCLKKKKLKSNSRR